jgi:hypothetical protein
MKSKNYRPISSYQLRQGNRSHNAIRLALISPPRNEYKNGNFANITFRLFILKLDPRQGSIRLLILFALSVLIVI